jgi:hypothetical protein
MNRLPARAQPQREKDSSGARVQANWASSVFAGSGDIFATLHSGLTVRLVSTPRDQLKTCKKDALISDVLQSNHHFDFMPVLEESSEETRFIGLFHASEARKVRDPEGQISTSFVPLTEEYLIGADASILDFVVQADTRPCRLVVSGAQIVGLVTLSDLQRLPVRAALFALITGFEMTMIDFIKTALPNESAWKAMLKPRRLERIEREIAIALARDAFVDALLYTQFCDKTEIIRRLNPNGMNGKSLERQLTHFESLRNSLAHANEYAATPEQAKHVCKLVRELLSMRRQLRERASREFRPSS